MMTLANIFVLQPPYVMYVHFCFWVFLFCVQTAALAKKIDKIADAGSLVPGDVHNCVRRVVAVQEALDR